MFAAKLLSYVGLLLPLLGGYLMWTSPIGAPGAPASEALLDEIRREGQRNRRQQRIGFAVITLGVALQAIATGLLTALQAIARGLLGY